MITQTLLFIVGLLFIWIGFNSLSKLKENNQKLREIERTYIVPNDVYYEKRKETFEEAKQLVKKFQRYIPILSNMSIVCGILSLLGIFLINQNINADLTLFGYSSFAMLLLSVFSIYFVSQDDTGGFIDTMVYLNTKYNLIVKRFLNKEEILVVKSIKDIFSEYISEDGYMVVYREKYLYLWHINGRILALFSLYLGIFLFLIAFIFDKNFYQMIISFN